MFGLLKILFIDKSCQIAGIFLHRERKQKHKDMNNYSILFSTEIEAFIEETIAEAKEIQISLVRNDR